MLPIDQLRRWVKGESVHNEDRDECCPDFSCCNPDSAAPQFERDAFLKAYEESDEESWNAMLGIFLGRGIASCKTEDPIKTYVSDARYTVMFKVAYKRQEYGRASSADSVDAGIAIPPGHSYEPSKASRASDSPSGSV